MLLRTCKECKFYNQIKGKVTGFCRCLPARPFLHMVYGSANKDGTDGKQLMYGEIVYPLVKYSDTECSLFEIRTKIAKEKPQSVSTDRK